MEVYKILLPLNVPEAFDYISDLELKIGDFVEAPFRGKPKMGVVWGKGESHVDDYKIKKIEEKLELPPLPENLIKFVDWVADYNMSSLGNVLKMCLSVKFIKKQHEPKNQEINFTLTSLTKPQEEAAEALREDVKNAKFSVSLLDGVTGSGKTEVYFEAIDEAISEGKQVLVLLPEIALSIQWLERFKKRFGVEPHIWHSDRTPKQRRETWLDVCSGDAKLVVGARSALFLPFKNLGAIIVDEEHDGSYKQEEGVTYHGRDMAVVRASIEQTPICLVSATPSIETVNNVQEGKYKILHLPERFGGASLPQIELVDMRLENLPAKDFISKPVRDALNTAIENKQQAVLFLNRRGYAPLTICRTCGHRIKCPNCSAWMVQHKQSASMQCHHCGYHGKMPNACPECDAEESLHACGPGVERIFDEVKNLLPDSNVEIISSDSPKDADEIIGKMQEHKIDVLVGTQMIAKGHHFPKLAFVGIIDADLGLEGGDLRAMERTYQLLHQVAGRAGRAEDIGKVMIQSYQTENDVFQALIADERDKFIESEMSLRKKFAMPPFGRLATITLSGKHESQVKDFIGQIAYRAPRSAEVTVLGPAPAPMSLLRGQHRYRLIIKTAHNINIQKYIHGWLDHIKIPSMLSLKIDVDPYSFV